MTIKISRSVTTEYTTTTEDGVQLTWSDAPAPCDHIDPAVERRDEGGYEVRYATDDEDGSRSDPRENDSGWNLVLFDRGMDADRALRDAGVEFDEDDCPVLGEREFWVSRHEHGLVRYFLEGSGSRPGESVQFDTAGKAGVIQMDGEWTPSEGRSIEHLAGLILEEFTSWANGDVYGLVRINFDADGNVEPMEYKYRNAKTGEWASYSTDYDDVWGFIGTDYAESCVKSGDF